MEQAVSTMSVGADRNTALLIRVWGEEIDAFHARLTALGGSAGEVSVEDLPVVVVQSPGDVLDAVRAWLEDFLGDAVTPVDSGE
jgi:hypothetical protein